MLGFGILEDCLDGEIGIRHALAVDVGAKTAHGGLDLGAGLQFLLEQRAGALEGRLDEAQFAVLQGDVEAFQCRPGRDVAAHRAGTHHVYMFDTVLDAAAEPLQALLQEEDADQVVRGRRASQF